MASALPSGSPPAQFHLHPSQNLLLDAGPVKIENPVRIAFSYYKNFLPGVLPKEGKGIIVETFEMYNLTWGEIRKTAGKIASLQPRELRLVNAGKQYTNEDSEKVNYSQLISSKSEGCPLFHIADPLRN